MAARIEKKGRMWSGHWGVCGPGARPTEEMGAELGQLVGRGGRLGGVSSAEWGMGRRETDICVTWGLKGKIRKAALVAFKSTLVFGCRIERIQQAIRGDSQERRAGR